ncbi:MAG: C-GCAxxG-C-C family (seleno)protein [Bacteroidales bacterium]|nr:C-GCAxxG-C-C family (seleno)protein [Bacteroidales bacterium]
MDKKITRKDFFKKTATYTTGVGVAAVGTGLLFSQEAKAEGLAEEWPAPYDALDIETVRINAHDDFCTEGKGCCFAAFNAPVNLLRAQLPATFPAFPNEIMIYGHGGVAGWGTICGAINGAAALISLVCDKASSDQLINELCGWYTQALIPTEISNDYASQGTYSATISDEVLVQNACGSVLCHVSCTKWCNVSGIAVNDPKRKERCARLTGDVAAKAAELLNEHFSSGFSAEYVAPSSIAACMTCQGAAGSKKNVASESECEQCHGDYQEAHKSVGQKSFEANSFSVEQNFPNPFSNRTTIRYSLDRQDSVSIEIFDIQGRRIKTIMSNMPHVSGEYTIEWDGTNDQGGRAEAGVYIFRFRAGSKIQTVSMMKV